MKLFSPAPSATSSPRQPHRAHSQWHVSPVNLRLRWQFQRIDHSECENVTLRNGANAFFGDYCPEKRYQIVIIMMKLDTCPQSHYGPGLWTNLVARIDTGLSHAPNCHPQNFLRLPDRLHITRHLRGLLEHGTRAGSTAWGRFPFHGLARDQHILDLSSRQSAGRDLPREGYQGKRVASLA